MAQLHIFMVQIWTIAVEEPMIYGGCYCEAEKFAPMNLDVVIGIGVVFLAWILWQTHLIGSIPGTVTVRGMEAKLIELNPKKYDLLEPGLARVEEIHNEKGGVAKFYIPIEIGKQNLAGISIEYRNTAINDFQVQIGSAFVNIMASLKRSSAFKELAFWASVGNEMPVIKNKTIFNGPSVTIKKSDSISNLNFGNIPIDLWKEGNKLLIEIAISAEQ